MLDSFRKFAHSVAAHAGRPVVFGAAVFIVLAWAVAGPILGFSTRWQLFINSFTTIVTFLMVFLIQATQNRDSREVHLKLDELIRTQRRARKSFENLEDATEEELRALEAEFHRVKSSRSNPDVKRQADAARHR